MVEKKVHRYDEEERKCQSRCDNYVRCFEASLPRAARRLPPGRAHGPRVTVLRSAPCLYSLAAGGAGNKGFDWRSAHVGREALTYVAS